MNLISKLKRPAAVTCLAVVAVTAYLHSETPRDSTVTQTKAVAPPWDLKDLDGKRVKSTDFKGKVVILDFWATWCPPCRAEIPSFVELHKKYERDGLAIIGVSLDDGGAKTVKPFVKQFGINYPVVIGDERVSAAFGGIEALPTTFVIDREGRIVNRHIGLTEASEFEKEIKPLLKR